MSGKKKATVFLLGQYGSGKDTHGPWIAEQFGLEHLSFSSLLRQDPIALRFINRAELVPDNNVFHILNVFPLKGYLVNGFPRTIPQLRFILETYVLEHIAFIYLDVVDEVAIHRMSNRLACSLCHTTTSLLKGHVIGGPCKIAGCPGILQKRISDLPENIRKRMRSFRHDTLPLLEEVKKSGMDFYRITIIQEQPIEKTREMIAKAMYLLV